MPSKTTAAVACAAVSIIYGCGDVPNLVECGEGTIADGRTCMPGEAGAFFDEIERGIIVDSFGVIPEQAPPEPTNRFADDPAAALLGQKFYFEARYSEGGDISCATCHDPAAGFQDARHNTSLGLDFTGRHAPTVINAGLGALTDEPVYQFWDGRADSLWSQALGPPESPVEMGGARAGITKLMYEKYRDEYEAIFGEMPEPIAPDSARPGTPEWDALDPAMQETITGIYVNFGKAIGAYERRVISRRSRFDFFYEEIAGGAEDSDHLSVREKRGLRLFFGKANCVACHRGANFTDGRFANIGVAQEGPHVPEQDPGRMDGRGALEGNEFNCASQWSDIEDPSDCVLGLRDDEHAGAGAFKTPGLRDISQTAPYMHTGSMWTLEEVVEHYNDGGDIGGFMGALHPAVFPLELTESEVGDVVAFMEALDGEPLEASLRLPPVLPE